MPFAVGIDLASVEDVEASLLSLGERYLGRVFTEREIADSQGRAERLAARFAVKEATMKALDVGAGGIEWRSIEAVEEPNRQWRIELSGNAARLAERRGVRGVCVSLSHQRTHAAAIVLVETRA